MDLASRFMLPLLTLTFAFALLVGCGADSDNAQNANTNSETQSANQAPPHEGPAAGGETPGGGEKANATSNEAGETLAGPPVKTAPDVVPPELLAQGWIALFDGETLYGWEPQNEANWSVVDDAITVSEGEKGLLTTALPFTDYQLRLEFKADADTNSGVFLRSTAQPTAPSGDDADCYELNIAPADNPFPTGSLVGREKVDGAKVTDDWRSFDITVNGPRVTVLLDGEQVLDYTDPKPLAKGLIGLQLNSGQVAFRNILLRPLNLQSIFNGQNLDGWSAPESPAVFTVTEDGELNVKNGRGHLESEESYADFVLQLECISHAEQLNSGIFFRCVPGSAMDGYESQIHNGYKNGDRRQPVDHGTGGIFRRQPARLVVADDLEWFHKTVIVDGSEMAVWVNGYQVSYWNDTRAPDENPRRGLRQEAGTLMIQGHDPTTDLSFRNLRIRTQ